MGSEGVRPSALLEHLGAEVALPLPLVGLTEAPLIDGKGSGVRVGHDKE
jgi:hypothetical protein